MHKANRNVHTDARIHTQTFTRFWTSVNDQHSNHCEQINSNKNKRKKKYYYLYLYGFGHILNLAVLCWKIMELHTFRLCYVWVNDWLVLIFFLFEEHLSSALQTMFSEQLTLSSFISFQHIDILYRDTSTACIVWSMFLFLFRRIIIELANGEWKKKSVQKVVIINII